ncbi:MAG TPA: helix-turn-helix domain-containing protein [Solirubrobacteraceae bacterium]|jgi:DNA-binding HxlR family transcriptional regulator|nr:helix-turn-helix domain-containing protein [Solirubrobacteraceae bacterium]
MEGYGEFCPVSLAAEIFARRWTPLIVRELLAGSTRFNDLRRGIPNVTASVLSRRLDELAIAGIIERRQDETGMRYVLTTAGEELRPVVEQLGRWGRRWLPTEYREQDLDPRLLVWDIHRNLKLDEVSKRTVVELHFSDAPAEYRAYWLVVSPSGAEVCLTHPGGEVDLHLSSDVRTLTNVWMGNTTWASALRDGSLKLVGARELRRAFPGWLKLNVFAAVQPLARSS